MAPGVEALLARTQGCAASGTQAHAKLALEPALAAVSTFRLVLDVRAHCYKAVPLAPHLGSGAAPVETGVGRILRRLQASRQWHFQQLVVRDSNRRTSEARTRPARGTRHACRTHHPNETHTKPRDFCESSRGLSQKSTYRITD